MSWRDRLQPARFRGVRFFVQGHEVTGGRITAAHQIPGLEDGGLVQDIGRQLDTFQLDAFLLGPDYDLQRARLERVCKAPSPGFPVRPGSVLVHPYLARKSVVCTSISIQEESREQEMCRLTLSFIEAGASSFDPSERHTDPARNAVERADATDAAASDALEQDLQVSGVPETVRAATAGVLDAWSSALGLLSTAQVARDDVASFAKTISGIASNATALATSPAGLVLEVRNALAQITNAVAGGVRGTLAAYESLLGETLSFSPTGSAIAAANANAETTRGFIQQATLAAAVRSAVEVEWTSTNEALAARARLESVIESQIESLASDSVYSALVQLKAALATSLPLPEANLATVETASQASTQPALVAAFELGADESDLIARNAIEHPGFVPAGPLEFLRL